MDDDTTTKPTARPQDAPQSTPKSPPEEIGGPPGPEPTRFRDREHAGRCPDG